MIDTDQLADKCDCDAHCEIWSVVNTSVGQIWFAECVDGCGKANAGKSKDEAIRTWNKERRKVKKCL